MRQKNLILAVLTGQAQISWLDGRNHKYTVQRIRISWTTVRIDKQPEWNRVQ